MDNLISTVFIVSVFASFGWWVGKGLYSALTELLDRLVKHYFK